MSETNPILPRAANNYVLIRRAKKVEKTEGGIYLADTGNTPPPAYGEVVSTGWDSNGFFDEGDVVFFRPEESDTVEFGGEVLYCVMIASILAYFSAQEAEDIGLSFETES